MNKLQKFLIAIIIVFTILLLMQNFGFFNFEAFKAENIIAFILKIREWIAPHLLKIMIPGMILLAFGWYFSTLDKDFESTKSQIYQKKLIREIFPNYEPIVTNIKTEPWSSNIMILGFVILIILVFLLLAPEIFQVEAPEISEIVKDYRNSKGE